MAGWRKPSAWLPLYNQTSLTETIISDLIDFPGRWGAKQMCEFGNLFAIRAAVLNLFDLRLAVIDSDHHGLACLPIDQQQRPFEALELPQLRHNRIADYLDPLVQFLRWALRKGHRAVSESAAHLNIVHSDLIDVLHRRFANQMLILGLLPLIVALLVGGLDLSLRLIQIDVKGLALDQINQQQRTLVAGMLLPLGKQLFVQLEGLFAIFGSWLLVADKVDIGVHCGSAFLNRSAPVDELKRMVRLLMELTRVFMPARFSGRITSRRSGTGVQWT